MSKLLVPYFTAGYPKMEWFESTVRALDEAGADFIEIGVPFSDPIADGPTIQDSSQRALDNGTTVRWILDTIKGFRSEIKAELIFFSYYNPLVALGGLEQAAKELKAAGFHGVLIPDLALEQAGQLVEAMRAEGLHYIPLIAPTTTEERLKAIAPHTTSFAYGVSVTGVTGARSGVSHGLDDYLSRVRKHFGDKPFVVGFGISNVEDAKRISKIADGVVLGSAVIKEMADVKTEDELKEKLKSFLGEIRQAIDNP